MSLDGGASEISYGCLVHTWCLSVLHDRRKALFRQARPGKRRNRLNTRTPTNALFVLSNGNNLTTSRLRPTIRHIIIAAGLTNFDQYSTYSLRIGSTTHCERVRIPHTKTLQYVGWARGNLPDMAHRYTIYPPQSLQWMAHDMMHGYQGERRTASNGLTVYDPWTSHRRWKLPPPRQ